MQPTSPPPGPARRGPVPTKHVDILWAAVRLFGTRGVAQTTTRDVAAEAGTTERTLFKHFGSKDALVQAVISEAVVSHLAPSSLQALRRAIEGLDDDLEQWHRELLQARSSSMAAMPELTRLLLVEMLRDDALRARFAESWLQAAWEPLLALFRKLQREGKVRRDLRADALTRMFLSLNLGHLLARHLLAPGLHWDDAAEIAAIAALFSRGCAPDEVRTRPR
jgi:AcrR family transcriptional regulator